MSKCWNCGMDKNLKAVDPEEYRLRKTQNALETIRKRKERRSKLGRPKARDDNKIKELRASGLSIREIAFQLKISAAAVQRGMK